MPLNFEHSGGKKTTKIGDEGVKQMKEQKLVKIFTGERNSTAMSLGTESSPPCDPGCPWLQGPIQNTAD